VSRAQDRYAELLARSWNDLSPRYAAFRLGGRSGVVPYGFGGVAQLSGLSNRRVLGMFKACMDESGTDAASPIASVAGWIATLEDWAGFERQWLEALGDYGVTYFHMKEFAHSTGQFKDWKGNENRRKAFLKRLTKIVDRWSTFGIWVRVPKDEYRACLSEDEQSDMGDPYLFCLYTVITFLVPKWPALWRDAKLTFVFEENKEWSSQAQTNYFRLKRKLIERLGKRAAFLSDYFTYCPKLCCVPLQAADFLAWESTKQLRELSRPMRGSLKALLASEKILPGDVQGPVLRRQVNLLRALLKDSR